MADFLTRLIERSRGFTPSGQRVEPLIAPFYAAGPNAASSDGPTNEEVISVAELEPLREVPAPHINNATAAQGRDQNIFIAPSPQYHESRDKVSPEIKPARALADETQSARLNQT